MRLIALLGVLFVLGGCSDSDMPDNFSVSCYQVGKFYGHEYYESYDFDFDNNIVTSKTYMGNNRGDYPFTYDITEITPTHIHFGKGVQELTFSRSDLSLSYYDFVYGVISTIDYRCKLPQV